MNRGPFGGAKKSCGNKIVVKDTNLFSNNRHFTTY